MYNDTHPQELVPESKSCPYGPLHSSERCRWEIVLIPEKFVILNDTANHVEQWLSTKLLSCGMNPDSATGSVTSSKHSAWTHTW